MFDVADLEIGTRLQQQPRAADEIHVHRNVQSGVALDVLRINVRRRVVRVQQLSHDYSVVVPNSLRSVTQCHVMSNVLGSG